MFSYLSVINLWNPTHISGIAAIIIVALLLGLIHGITPDEHTWPITFSYAVGSYSTKRGLRSGIIFSLAFTLQAAIGSELAYLGLTKLFTFGTLNYYVYMVVGLLMTIAGVMIVESKLLNRIKIPVINRFLHIEEKIPEHKEWVKDPRPWMPAVHGFIAGWGFDAFSLIIYTVLAPSMHSPYFGWIPGAVFGVGTLITQAIAGATFGILAIRKGLSRAAIRKVALKTAGRTLTWGGVAFIIAGVFSIFFPSLNTIALNTGLHIHNLDSLGLAFFLVVICVVGVGLTTLIKETKSEIFDLKVRSS
jgi:hypothetical protein